MAWYVRGEGRSMAPTEIEQRGGEGGRTQGCEGRQREEASRRKAAAQATHATREGARLAWWLMRGEGADARGPISVRRGAPNIPTQR